ncbi:MAG: hypothetical protein ACLTBV_19455 [Enterocloster bolteae]
MAAVNMTEGNITKHLVGLFQFRLILGNLFQLTYNAVDSIIAGRFIGKGSAGRGRHGQSGHEYCHHSAYRVSVWVRLC